MVDSSNNCRFSPLSAVTTRVSTMTSLTPPMIIGGLAVLTTAIGVVLIVCGLWTVITGRDIVWKVSPRLSVAELVRIAVYARLQGESMVRSALKLLVRHQNTGRKVFGRRRPRYAHAYRIAREILTNMLPMQETPAPRSAKSTHPTLNFRHDLLQLGQAGSRGIRTVRR